MIYDAHVSVRVMRDATIMDVPFCELCYGDYVADAGGHLQYMVSIGAHEHAGSWLFQDDRGRTWTPLDFSAPAINAPKEANIGDVVRLGGFWDGCFGLPTAYTGAKTPSYLGLKISFTDELPAEEPDMFAVPWVKVSDEKLIADRNLLRNVTWSQLKDAGFIGKGVEVEFNSYHYRIRVPAERDWIDGIVKGPYKGNETIWHCKDMYSWCADNAPHDGNSAILYGGGDAANWTMWKKDDCHGLIYDIGFRPMLQILD